MDSYSRPWTSHIQLARQIAEDSRPDDFRVQVVALAIHRAGHPFAYGVNKRRYSRGASVFLDSLHAEADLIKRAGDKIAGAKVLLYRFNKATKSPFAGQPLNAKPCLLCSHSLREAGVKSIVFVDDDNVIQQVKGSDLPLLIERPDVLTRMFVERTIKSKTFSARLHLAS